MSESFVIPVNGLAQGVTEFRLEAGEAFFASYGNPDILNASVSVRVLVRKSGRTVDIDCIMEGRVSVPCDRCLAEVELPVSATALLRVGAGGEEEGEEVDGREIVLDDPLPKVLTSVRSCTTTFAPRSRSIRSIRTGAAILPQAAICLRRNLYRKRHPRRIILLPD